MDSNLPEDIDPFETVVVGETRNISIPGEENGGIKLTEVKCTENNELSMDIIHSGTDPELGGVEVEFKVKRIYKKDGDSLLVNEIDTMSAEGQSLTNNLLYKCSKK